MTVFENIQRIAKEHGLTLMEVNNKAGLGTRTIYRWKNKKPTIENLEKVAHVLHTSIDTLLDDSSNQVNAQTNKLIEHGHKYSQYKKNATSQIMHQYPIGGSPLRPLSDDDIDTVKRLEPHNYQVRVPILGKIACGEPIFAEQNIVGYKDLTFDHKPDGTLFLLQCQGHSMEPLIPDGSLVTIRRQAMVENGELAAVLIDDGATIKRVKFTNGEIILLPENTQYDPILLNDKNPGRSIGKVIHVDYDVL